MADLMRDVQVQRYYPNVLANAAEFKLIAKLENAEFKSVWQEACKWFLNTFVYDTDLQGIKRWEDMLKIIPPKEATLEDRRNTVLMRINTMLPYTITLYDKAAEADFKRGIRRGFCNRIHQ